MSDRKPNGQFAKGNQIGKGNSGGRPAKAREERYYDIAMNACSFTDWRVIIKTAVNQAKDGDAIARKWLADYLMGPPVRRLEHSGPDGGPIEEKHTIDLSRLDDAELDALAGIAQKFTGGDSEAESQAPSA